MNRWSVVSWLATLLGVVTCVWRALNLDYQALSYALSCAAYVVYIVEAPETSEGRRVALRNAFYLVTSLVGFWRWSSVA